MSEPRTAREALYAELLGDLQVLLDRIDQLRGDLGAADASAKQTAAALDRANAQYRAQVDDMMARLRAEFAGLVATATDRAVAAQATALKTAAVAAMRTALSAELETRQRAGGLRQAVASAVVGVVLGLATAFAALHLGGM